MAERLVSEQVLSTMTKVVIDPRPDWNPVESFKVRRDMGFAWKSVDESDRPIHNFLEPMKLVLSVGSFRNRLLQ